jgi:hypothetical protein
VLARLRELKVGEEVFRMWDEHKRSRFQALRARQREGILSEAEQAELEVLGRDLDAIEAVFLIPATERIRQERVALESQNRILEGLTVRKEALVRRLRDFLAEAQAERHAIERQLAEVVAGSRKSETDE